MTSKNGFLALALLSLFCGNGAAMAQTAGPDEAVRPNGAVSQKLALTPAQESAIYNAVIRQRGRMYTTAVPIAVGAPVPPSVELRELPDQAAADNPWTDLLKYAMVENTVVVIDPIRMRVVGIIRDGAKP
jgi:hypothetical protein